MWWQKMKKRLTHEIIACIAQNRIKLVQNLRYRIGMPMQIVRTASIGMCKIVHFLFAIFHLL